MHNLHFVVVKADSPEDACNTVESAIQDFGNENNWRQICGCISQDNEVHDKTKEDQFGGRWSPNEKGFNTLADLNKLVEGWMKESYYSNTAKKKIARAKGKIDFSKWNTGDLYSLEKYAQELYQTAKLKESKKGKKDKGFNILTDEYFAWSYDEMGVTQLDGEDGEKTYVVFVDMHS